MHVEVRIGAGEVIDEVILESGDVSFSYVCSVEIWGH